jgi:hypothetical protein
LRKPYHVGSLAYISLICANKCFSADDGHPIKYEITLGLF